MRNFFCEYFLIWIFPTLFRGARNKLSLDQVPLLPDEMKAGMVIPLAIQSFAKRRNLLWVTWDLCKREIIIAVIVSFCAGLLSVVVRPLLVGYLVEEIASERYLVHQDKSHALTLVGILCCVLLGEGFSVSAVKHALADIAGHKMFCALTGLIQRKLQRLPNSQGKNSISEVSLIGIDAFRVYENLRFFNQIILAWVGFIGGIIVLIVQIGTASLVGIAVMLIIVFTNTRLAKRASHAEERDLEVADKRTQLLRQMITGIKAIKLCAWEESFLKKIIEIRKEEMKHLGRYRLIAQSNVQIGRACPIISAASSFLFIAIRGDNVTSAQLFSTLNVFLAMRLSLILIPDSVTISAAIMVSLERIEKYLLLPEAYDDEHLMENDLYVKNSDKGKGIYSDYPEAEFSLKDDGVNEIDTLSLAISGQFQWIENTDFTVNANLKLQKGKSYAVVSRVGQGKSSFLHALLGELNPITPQSYAKRYQENVAFIPQHAIILGGSVLENVALGDVSPQDKLLLTSIHRSALDTDLKLLTNGIQTIIGERGINFSGGQQQRVAIARAVYHCLKHNEKSEGTLLVVDDALAAVDVHVGDHLFHSAFLQHVKDDSNNTLVMSVNQTKYLKYFDFIIELVDGKTNKFLPVNEKNLAELGLSGIQKQTILVDHARQEKEGIQQDDDSKDKNQDDLYQKEGYAKGLVSGHVLYKFAKAMGFKLLFSCLMAGVCAYATMSFQDIWFSRWVGKVGARALNPSPALAEEYRQENLKFVEVYSGCVVTFLFFLLCTSALWSYAGVVGSKSLHSECMTNLLHCPISFFEKTPSGRIIARFTSDLSVVDLGLGRLLDNLWQLLVNQIALMAVVAILAPPIAAVLAIAFVVHVFEMLAVDRANRVMKRENNLAMGPLQLSISENIEAKLVARLMKFNGYFNKRFYENLDHWTRYGFGSGSVITSYMLISYLVSFCICCATAFYIVLSDALSPSYSGLALTYSFLIPYFMYFTGYYFTIVLSTFSSLERIIDYTDDKLPKEPPWSLPEKKDPLTLASDTKKGKVEFRNVTLVYRKGLIPALRGLSFTINAGEKIGIIGRTGAGKSSIILLLLRILDPTEGKVLIDNIDISSLGILELRRSICIIPQTPLLLRGTVQDNIAPFGQAPLNAMKSAVVASGLLDSIPHRHQEKGEGKMETQSEDVARDAEQVLQMEAEQLSAGQKQLLSLTRCLLRTDNHLLICDEPTSNVDIVTDRAVQAVVREKFRHATIITVAHRLETIADSDRIIVMEKGQVKQIGAPSVILTQVEI